MSESQQSPQPLQPWPQQWKAGLWRELIFAAKYLTRLRIPLRGMPDRARIGGAMAWFPLIGALIGAFGASVDAIASMAGLPAELTATLAVMAMMWLTRALHEEELASLANQYGDLGDRSRRVGWLKEDRSIRYGSIALMFALLLKINAIASLNNGALVYTALIASGAWSHAVMAVAAAWLRPMPGDPVSDHFGQPPGDRVLIALILGIVINIAVLGVDAGASLGVGSLVALIITLIGTRLLGGYNGPLLGGLQQITELAVICAIVAAQ